MSFVTSGSAPTGPQVWCGASTRQLHMGTLGVLSVSKEFWTDILSKELLIVAELPGITKWTAISCTKTSRIPFNDFHAKRQSENHFGWFWQAWRCHFRNRWDPKSCDRTTIIATLLICFFFLDSKRTLGDHGMHHCCATMFWNSAFGNNISWKNACRVLLHKANQNWEQWNTTRHANTHTIFRENDRTQLYIHVLAARQISRSGKGAASGRNGEQHDEIHVPVRTARTQHQSDVHTVRERRWVLHDNTRNKWWEGTEW